MTTWVEPTCLWYDAVHGVQCTKKATVLARDESRPRNRIWLCSEHKDVWLKEKPSKEMPK